MNREKFSKLFWEIVRFGLVGGICFLIDTCVFLLMNRMVFNQPITNPDVFYTGVSTALGFLIGLLVNYLLSRFFVFTQKEQKENGKGVKSFILFVVISVIGLVLTEFFVWLFCPVIGWPDFIAKIIAAGLVMIWNYVGRKILIFK